MQARSSARLTDRQLVEVAKMFAALGEPSRLKLLRALMDGSASVGELMVATGLKQANASKHLGCLLAMGFVERRTEGNFARYAICDPLVQKLCETMCRRARDGAREVARALA